MGEPSIKIDVYAYIVIHLEITVGRKVIEESFPDARFRVPMLQKIYH
jgi:hypothetical protein